MIGLPAIGFGTSPFRPAGRLTSADVEKAVATALDVGYRLIDTAELYGSEAAVGRALRASGVARDEVSVVGKVWRTNYRPEAMAAACAASLRRLGLDRFDLYLLHAPEAWRHVAPLDDPDAIGWAELERRALPRDAQGDPARDDVPLRESWEALRDLCRRGLVDAPGVSNFSPEQIAALGDSLPAVNQMASSPYRPQAETAEWCLRHGIGVMAHSPLAAPGLLAEPKLAALARIHGASPAAVVLAWHRQLGRVPLPASTRPEHIAANLRSGGLVLEAAELRAIEGLATV